MSNEAEVEPPAPTTLGELLAKAPRTFRITWTERACRTLADARRGIDRLADATCEGGFLNIFSRRWSREDDPGRRMLISVAISNIIDVATNKAADKWLLNILDGTNEPIILVFNSDVLHICRGSRLLEVYIRKKRLVERLLR